MVAADIKDLIILIGWNNSIQYAAVKRWVEILMEAWNDKIFELTEYEENEFKEAVEILKKYYEEMWLRGLVNLHEA